MINIHIIAIEVILCDVKPKTQQIYHRKRRDKPQAHENSFLANVNVKPIEIHNILTPHIQTYCVKQPRNKFATICRSRLKKYIDHSFSDINK